MEHCKGWLGVDFVSLKAKLFDYDALRITDETQQQVVGSIQPEHATSWPSEILSPLRDELVRSGIDKPYKHQAEAIRSSLAGHDVVLESPTASGKTLAFTVPMLDALLRKLGSHALMIYPMKALAFDQREQLRKLCESFDIESWPYDGDVGPEHRRLLRENPPQILLTNPELLSMSFLAYREQWEKFLRNLEYVVIDEMHIYRGFFGCNMALLLRRFFLQMDRLGANPKVFLSTATCANPDEHAKNLTGRDVKVISARDVLKPRRHFLFVNPDIPEHLFRQIFQLRIENAAQTIFEHGLQALIFCPTKRFLEAAFRNCQRKAEENNIDPHVFAAFHADLRNEQRQEIQQNIKSGKIRVIFSTNALEVGLDIGGLDGVVLAGFPSNIMSAWQQIGRAGRSWNRDSFVLFYAMNDPIDQFFVNNIKDFLNRPFDHLVIDTSNSQLIENHMASLVQETGGIYHGNDRHILGQEFYQAASEDNSRPVNHRRYRPQRTLNLRGGSNQSLKLKYGNSELGQISDLRCFREAYLGAIFTFYGKKYRVQAREVDAIQLVDADPYLKTEGSYFSLLSILDIFEGQMFDSFEVYHGRLNLAMNFQGYSLIDERSEEVIDRVNSHDALYHNRLHAVWIGLNSDERDIQGIGALEQLLRVGAMFIIPADRFDNSTWATLKDGGFAYYYENYEGGVGVAKKLYQVWATALEKGIEVAQNCSCDRGCQNCIEPAKSWNLSNVDIDKRAGIVLAQELLAANGRGPTHGFKNGRMVPL